MSGPTQSTSPKLSLLEKLHFVSLLIRLPFVVLAAAFRSALARPQSINDFKRSTVIDTSKFFIGRLSTPQMICLQPPSRTTYKGWAKANNAPVVIDDLEEDTPLFWLGPRQNGRVVLVVHGGALHASLSPFHIKFFKFIQEQLHSPDKPVGMVMVAYGLVPTRVFPSQTYQLMVAVEHLIATGVHPNDLYLMGDSAGALIITSLLAHILHPMPGLRPMAELQAPLGGLCLLSPWSQLVTTSSGSFKDNLGKDILTLENLNDWGERVLKGIPKDLVPYIDPASAPTGSFSGLSALTDRILVTAGDIELLRDPIVNLADILKRESGIDAKNVELIVQKGGVHDDFLLDFQAGSPRGPEDLRSTLTMRIVDWFNSSFRNDAAPGS